MLVGLSVGRSVGPPTYLVTVVTELTVVIEVTISDNRDISEEVTLVIVVTVATVVTVVKETKLYQNLVSQKNYIFFFIKCLIKKN